MPEQLHFRLYAGLASWGDIAVGEMRPSANRPSRSAILGLLAAALGIRREQEDQLQALNHVGIAMRVDAYGLPLHDYHTTQAPKSERKVNYQTRRDEINWNQRHDLSTILSNRAYRQDSLVHIAVLAPTTITSGVTLAACRQALEEPSFPLYLGRRSCPPALPLAPRLITAATCSEALNQNPPPALELPGQATLPCTNHDQEHWYWDDYWQHSGAAPAPAQRQERRHDQKSLHRSWLFCQRNEYSAVIKRAPAETTP